MAQLELANIHKKYSDIEVLKNINLSIETGELIVFVGPSGCGKSTLLRSIAGLEEINQGDIIIDGRNVVDDSPASRGIAMVFQSYALYPHMSVYDNIAFNLKLRKQPSAEIEAKVNEVAAILHLEPYLQKLPKFLSGGQRQRVAIGRALVRNPKIFLFDEPLSNLDAALRTKMRIEIARLHKRLRATMIYVTHDQTEAMTLSDRMVVLNKGQIEQVGKPLELYMHPNSLFVATFIGNPQMNIFQVQQTQQGYILANNTALAEITEPRVETLGIRPEHFLLTTKKHALLSGVVEIIEQFGEYILAYIKTDFGQVITVKVPPHRSISSQDEVHLDAKREHIHLFDWQEKRIASSANKS